MSTAAEYLPPDQATGRAPFIPAWLDDLGLSPAQFRVACRIARRGQCTECLKRMAKGCRIDRETLQRAIVTLIQLCVVTKVNRFGRTSILQLTPSGKDGLGSHATQRQRRATPQRQRRANHLAAKTGYKGTPFEGTPIKGDPPSGKLSDAERISAEKQLEREKEKLAAYRKRLPEVAGGETLKTDADRKAIRDYKDEIKRLEELLRI